jgi:hypothetical protein
MEKENFALESFKNIQELIRFVDQKSGAVLLVSGLIMTAFLEFSKNLIFNFESITSTGAFTFLFGVSTVLLLIYVIYLSIFKILRPRLAKFYSDGDSLFYFGHLAHMDRNNILENFKNLDDATILKNLSEQIFEVSRILDAKSNELHNSMNYLYLSLLSLLAFILVSRLH